MTDKIVKEINLETGDITERPMTSEEIADIESIAIESENKRQEIANKEVQRQAILNRLGLTAEEAALLLGGN
jgi:hypothetical protein